MFIEAREMLPGLQPHHIEISGMEDGSSLGHRRRLFSDAHNSATERYIQLVRKGTDQQQLEQAWNEIDRTNKNLPKDLQKAHTR